MIYSAFTYSPQPDSLDADLLDHLHFWLAQLTPAERRGAQWVMSPEWLIECRKASRAGLPTWFAPLQLTEPERLYGLPVEVCNDGGVPHLEPGDTMGT